MKLNYILFSYFALFSLGIIDNSRGPIYPELLDLFKINQSEGSFVFTVTSLISFMVTLLSPYWLRKFGVFFSSKIALISHSLACLCMWASVYFNLGFYLFLIGSFFVGIGIGINSLTVNLIISNSVEKTHRRRLFSGLHSMYGISALLAPSILSLLFKHKVPWTIYLLCLSLVPFVIFISFINLKDPSLREQKQIEAKLVKKEVFILGTIFSLYVATEMLVSTRLVVYLKEVKSFSMDMASGQLSLFFLLLLLGRLLFSIIHFPLKSVTLLKSSIVFTLITLLLGIYFEPYFLALSGLFMSFFFPMGMDWLSHHYEQEVDLVVAKVMSIVGGVLVLMHYTFGHISTLVGLEYSILMAPLMLLTVLYLLQFKTKFLA